MSADTPIYDATCRAVGPPPGAEHGNAAATADPSTSEVPVRDGAPPPPAPGSP